MRDHSDIKFESGDGTTVRLHFVDLTRMTETLEELRDKLEVTES
jgi:5-methylcytosine-specific restriction enzyme subunit McrC